MPEPAIEIATAVTPELVTAMRELLPQLSSSASPLTDEQLGAIIDSPATLLFVARVEGRIVGSLTLVLFRLPTGMRAWIEDVVVDGAARATASARRSTGPPSIRLTNEAPVPST